LCTAHEAAAAQGSDGAAADRAEAQHSSPGGSAVVTVEASQAEGVDHTGVARHFVVAVEDVHVAHPALLPQEHGFPGKQGQAPVDGYLGDFALLHAVWPAPEDAALAHLAEIRRQGLG